MINHVVLLRLKEGVTEEQLNDCLNAIEKLKEKIPGIMEVSGGHDNSPEHKNNGFTWGFMVKFDSAENRDNYVPHPEHQKVVEKYVLPILADSLIFNYTI
jgi:antibiotic biosynthesis monooxygenase (ABM) superfamily enzyme